MTTAPLPGDPPATDGPDGPDGSRTGPRVDPADRADRADPADPAGGGGLDARALAVLAMERRRYRNQGAKEQAVRDELGLSAARYHQLLNALLDDPAALAADPVLVGRLRRVRTARTADLPR